MAIAFGAATIYEVNGTTSMTRALTCTAGTNPYLIVGALTNDAATDQYSGNNQTYDGVNMTFVGYSESSGTVQAATMWKLANPTTGSAANIVLTRTGSGNLLLAAASYTGVGGGVTNFTTTSHTGSTTLAATLTPNDDNSWVVCVGRNNQNTSFAGSGTTIRTTANPHFLADNNAAITPQSSTTLNFTNGSFSANWKSVIAALSPTAASGPANLKSLDTNLKANIKSWNTNAIANIKSINTNT